MVKSLSFLERPSFGTKAVLDFREELQQAADEADPDAVVWKGVEILGTPVGDPEYVKAKVGRKTEEH